MVDLLTRHSFFNLLVWLNLVQPHTILPLVPSWTLKSCVAWLSFFLSWAGFFFQSLFLVSSLFDSSLNIQLGISPPWLSSSLLLPPLVLARAPLWFSAFQSGSGNIWRAPLTLPIITGYTGELTHITLQCPL